MNIIRKHFDFERTISFRSVSAPARCGRSANAYTVWHEGEGMPRWQIFAGLNLQFALGK